MQLSDVYKYILIMYLCTLKMTNLSFDFKIHVLMIFLLFSSYYKLPVLGALDYSDEIYSRTMVGIKLSW